MTISGYAPGEQRPLAGDVVWWPGSRFDGPSVFTRVLDPYAGHFSIHPAGACVSRRAYLDGTLVLQTDHDTGAGVLRVTDAHAERMRSTVAVADEVLGAGDLHRRSEERPDEGAFLPVTFWLAACHARAGEVDAARAAFERAAACANDVGLLAEMADPRTGAALGNTPQALSHVGLIVAANEIARAETAASAPAVSAAGLEVSR